MSPKPEDIRPTLNLGHLTIPRESASQDWLRRQGEKRQEAVSLVEEITREWLPGITPDFYPAFAARVIAALDQRI
jgi:hypothetical protein